MTIFDFISNILFTKNKDNIDLDDESEFTPFIVNRWLSMYSPHIVNICNYINKYQGIFDNKQDLYKLFFGIFPRVPSKKITYFKRIKETKDQSNNDTLKLMAKTRELSLREIKEYVELYKDITKS
jgi:hypothetical protein